MGAAQLFQQSAQSHRQLHKHSRRACLSGAHPQDFGETDSRPAPDGANDLDNTFGNWPLANQEMAAALKFAKYDYKFVFGDGQHSGKHAGSIFPDSLRWLWRDYK
jgi:enterochelin esterase family protein